jgi:hypothetical protein
VAGYGALTGSVAVRGHSGEDVMNPARNEGDARSVLHEMLHFMPMRCCLIWERFSTRCGRLERALQECACCRSGTRASRHQDQELIILLNTEEFLNLADTVAVAFKGTYALSPVLSLSHTRSLLSLHLSVLSLALYAEGIKLEGICPRKMMNEETKIDEIVPCACGPTAGLGCGCHRVRQLCVDDEAQDAFVFWRVESRAPFTHVSLVLSSWLFILSSLSYDSTLSSMP